MLRVLVTRQVIPFLKGQVAMATSNLDGGKFRSWGTNPVTSPKATSLNRGRTPRLPCSYKFPGWCFFFCIGSDLFQQRRGLEGILVHFYQFHLSPHFLNGRGASPSAVHRFFFFFRGELLDEGSMVLILSGLRHKQRFCFEIDESLNITTIMCWCV